MKIEFANEKLVECVRLYVNVLCVSTLTKNNCIKMCGDDCKYALDNITDQCELLYAINDILFGVNNQELVIMNKFVDLYLKYDLGFLIMQAHYVLFKQYNEFIARVKSAYNSLKDFIKNKGISMGDVNCINLQCALLKLSIVSIRCSRMTKNVCIVTPDSCIRVLDKLIKATNGYARDSLYNLKGDLYSFALGSYELASIEYRKAKNRKNAYAINRIVKCKLVNFRNYECAISICKGYGNGNVYPIELISMYFNLAYSYVKNRQYDEAITTFKNVENALLKRIEKKVMQPSEAAILFDNYLKYASLLGDKLGETKAAIRVLSNAESFYKCLDSVEWLDTSGLSNNEMKECIKSYLEIKSVYKKLSIYYDYLGNRKSAEKYYEMYENV